MRSANLNRNTGPKPQQHNFQTRMKLSLHYLAAGAAALTFTLASCGEDDPDPLPPVVENRAPTIDVALASGSMTMDTFRLTEQDQVGTVVGVNVTWDDADNNAQYLSFELDGQALGAGNTNVRLDDPTGSLSSNRVLVDSTGGSRTVYLKASNSFNTAATYTISVFDSEGLSASQEFVILTPVEIVTTPLSRTLEGILLNQAGPTGTGGLDLDEGDGTGSMDARAEIRDRGIDNSIPTGQENWRRQIGPINGTTLRMPSSVWLAENSFADVDTKEGVRAAFESTSVDITDASARVVVDDVFAVYNPAIDRYYLLKVRSVIPEANSNGDRYVFDIKY